MAYQTLLTDLDRGILTVRNNRPDRLNALSPEMLGEILDLLDEVDRNDAIRVVVWTGEGRAFCAGADLGGGAGTFDRSGEEEARAHRDGGGLAALRLFDCRKPLIAAINGPAVGVGVTMTLPMDVRIASRTARMGFVFARRGIVPEACSSWFLPRVVGINQAAEWVYTGRIFPAQEALAARLVSRVVAPGELLATARALAREMADGTSAMSVALARQLMWKMLGADHPMEAHKIDSQCIYWMGRSADAIEGVTSFLEKRPPQFKLKPSTEMPEFYPWWEERKFK